MNDANIDKNYKVYLHTFPNGKRYVGQTNQSPVEKRWGKNGIHYKGQMVYRAIKKYGWDNIDHRILFDGLDKNGADRIEKLCIFMFKSCNEDYGYNLDGGGYYATKSESTKKKFSQSRKGKLMADDNPASRAIICLELNKIWPSMHMAGNETGIFYENICAVAKRKLNTAGGYHWIYAEEFDAEVAKNILLTQLDTKNIPVVCIETNKFYENIKNAAESVNGRESALRHCLNGTNLNGKARTFKKLHWRKATEEEWLIHRSAWADKIISNLLSNEELMKKINNIKTKEIKDMSYQEELLESMAV